MNREYLIKGASAALTIGFFVAVRPENEPSMVITAFLAVMMYEAIRGSITYIARLHHKQYVDVKMYVTATKEDMRRVEAQRFYWPMEEVS